ncbi:MAG: ABC transporter permease [Candidatus Bipolaricaulia bacterium]
MKALGSLLRTEATAFRRDALSITFTFLFPILFILAFGAIMGSTPSGEGSRLGLAVAPGAGRTALDAILAETALLVHEMEDPGELEAAVVANDIDFGAIWDGTTLVFVYDVRRTQDNFTFEELAHGLAARLDLAAQGRSSLLTVEVETDGGEPEADWLALVIPGILAFSVLSAGLFAVAGHLTSMKQRRLLDRLIVTPMHPSALLGAIVGVRLGVVVISTFLTLGIAAAVFGIAYDVRWVHYGAFVLSATLGSMGLGAIIALVVRQPSSASSLANVLSMLMMFGSGIYFPVEVMPRFLQVASYAMPLRHMADAARYAVGVMDMSEAQFWAVCGSLLAAGLVLLPLLARSIVRSDRR